MTETPRHLVSSVLFHQSQRALATGLGYLALINSLNEQESGATGSQDSDHADHSVADDISTIVELLPSALMYGAIRAHERVQAVVEHVEITVNSVTEKSQLNTLISPWTSRIRAALEDINDRFTAEQAEHADDARQFLADAGPATLQELLMRVDLNKVLEQVDVNALLDRADLDAVVDKLDFNDVLATAIQEIQVAGLVRDSTGAIASSTVEALRSQMGGVAGLLARRVPPQDNT